VAWFFLTNHNSLLCIATNEIASFCIDNGLRQIAFCRLSKVGKGRLSSNWEDFEIKSWNCMFLLYKTNRFHVAVRLFSYRALMTSKCGKNKKVAHKAIAKCVTDVLTSFWRPLWSITEQTHGNMESIWNLYLTNTFHVAVRLFSNRSQMTSKWGKNISDTLGYRLVCHFFVLTTFWRHLWSITEQTHGNVESIC